MTTENHDILSDGKIHTWTHGVLFEDAAQEQVRNLAGLPFVRRVSVMPDVHSGKGSTVGTVMGTVGAIIPAAVGVDIGCGVSACRTSLTSADLPESLRKTRLAIEAAVPAGRTNNGRDGDVGAWNKAIPQGVEMTFIQRLQKSYFEITSDHPEVLHKRAIHQFGTLGTGNHFIEVCLDESNRVWVMLHSGSRGPGNAIGSYFIERAKEDMRRHSVNLPDQDLAYLEEGSTFYADYIAAVEWAQEYAAENRRLILMQTLQALRETLPPFTVEGQVVSCHHNYISRERHLGEDMVVTRKGAVSAHPGQLGIIPGSMGAKSYITRGLGNPDSLCSSSHGAGRVMSRTRARKTFTVADHVAATKGVECLKDESVLDETPGAYKQIEAVMAAQSDLVEIVHTLKAIVCVKGGDSQERAR